MLQTIGPVIGDTKVTDLRGRLEAGAGDAIAAEWEVAIIYCLSLQGRIEAINSCDGVREPDIIYVSSDGARVAVEVTALSDRSFHDKNPMRAFSGELLRITFKNGINGFGAIQYEIGSTDSPNGPVLGVPSRRDMAGFFASDAFRTFVAKIKSAPASPGEMAFQINGVRSRLKFVPGTRFGGGTHATFNLPVDVRSNPISSRLKAKDSQIAGSGLELPSVVFLCDADCYVLEREKISGNAASAAEIIELFLNGRHSGPFQRARSRSRRINGVVACRVKEEGSWFRPDFRRRHVVSEVVRNRSETCHALRDDCLAEIAACVHHLPPIARMPVNALTAPRWPTHYGGYRMPGGGPNSMKIEMSLTTLQRLLAGTLPTDQFARDHGKLVEQFKRATDAGKLISALKIKECPDDDDDWVEIELNAVAPTHLFKEGKDEAKGEQSPPSAANVAPD
jgi:hypothetical protein